jgi:hypothetical protein
MPRKATAHDHEAFAWCSRQGHVSHHQLVTWRPDFLIISPPKTGSTWLAENLRCHPQLFVPAIKEVRYFSSYFKALDLGWYLGHFAPGAGRVKGEASPSYALLPVERIRLIRRIMPELKLIFLLRDPVARAWSHAKHTYRFGEANFASCSLPLEAVPYGQWQENFSHEWCLANGDYLGQLRRWLSVFPKEQVYVGFYESIAHEPQALLRRLFRFLGVESDLDLAAFPAEERILPGLRGTLPPTLAEDLWRLLSGRTEELASFLAEQFGLAPPTEWATGSAAGTGLRTETPAVFLRDRDDHYIGSVLELEEVYPSAPRLVLAGYRGHDVFFFRGEVYALDHAQSGPDTIDGVRLQRRLEAGGCIVAPSLAEAKERVDEQVFGQVLRLGRTVELLRAERAEARGCVGDLLQGLERAIAKQRAAEVALRRLGAEVVGLTPWYVKLGRRAAQQCRRLRAYLAGLQPPALRWRPASGDVVDERRAA